MHAEKPATSATAFYVILCLVLAAVPSASAQTYTFSACSGVPIPGSSTYIGRKGTFTYTINQILSGGPVSVAGTSGYAYHVMATYTASTPEGEAKSFTNVESVFGSTYVPGLGNPLGQTIFMINQPALPTTMNIFSAGTWGVTLTGDGNPWPNGIAQPIPPISAWTTTNQGIKGDYVGVEGAATPGTPGIPLFATGPISGAKGNTVHLSNLTHLA
jgi:hypothetical protein